MKISLLCSSESHPVNGHLEEWIQRNRNMHEITLVRRKKDLSGGDVLFLVSCGEIISAEDRGKYRASLVLHASDLPRGRGWNPHIWAIIDGARQITVSLLEVEDKIDSGRIWRQVIVSVPKHLLWDEINQLLFNTEMELIDYAILNFETIRPWQQNDDIEPNYYRLRTPFDSQINPEESIVSQFDLLRICDPQRYPAFFELHGHRYKLILEKTHDQ
jgi:methionyl-tRNA formyltransferase